MILVETISTLKKQLMRKRKLKASCELEVHLTDLKAHLPTLVEFALRRSVEEQLKKEIEESAP